jgi:hypothetical protein
VIFFPLIIHLYLLAVIDFDNTDMAWRKYDSGKDLDENCGFLTFEI